MLPLRPIQISSVDPAPTLTLTRRLSDGTCSAMGWWLSRMAGFSSTAATSNMTLSRANRGTPFSILQPGSSPKSRTWRTAAGIRLSPLLGDGRVMTFSGLKETGGTNTAVELYTVGIRLEPAISQGGLDATTYPRMHLLPDGRVIYSGSGVGTRVFNLSTKTWSDIIASTIPNQLADLRHLRTAAVDAGRGYRPRDDPGRREPGDKDDRDHRHVRRHSRCGRAVRRCRRSGSR